MIQFVQSNKEINNIFSNQLFVLFGKRPFFMFVSSGFNLYCKFFIYFAIDRQNIKVFDVRRGLFSLLFSQNRDIFNMICVGEHVHGL